MTLTLLSTRSTEVVLAFERTPLAEKPPPTASRAPGSAGTTPGDSAQEAVNVAAAKGSSALLVAMSARECSIRFEEAGTSS